MEIQDFPVKLEELCSFTFNFENLIRIIQFLHKSHNDLVTEVRDLTKKVLLFEDVKSQIGDLQVKQRTTEISQKEMGETLSNLQSKLLEIDSKMSNIDQKAFQAINIFFFFIYNFSSLYPRMSKSLLNIESLFVVLFQ